MIILTDMPQNTSSLTVTEFSCKCHAKKSFDEVAEVVWQTFEMNFYQTRGRKGKNVIQYQRHFPLTGPGDQVIVNIIRVEQIVGTVGHGVSIES